MHLYRRVFNSEDEDGNKVFTVYRGEDQPTVMYAEFMGRYFKTFNWWVSDRPDWFEVTEEEFWSIAKATEMHKPWLDLWDGTPVISLN